MSRPPANLFESFAANCRPQPAIPALLVLLLCGLYFFMATAPTVAPGVGAVTPALSLTAAWGITLGVLVSCALAVAAGFCSLFPMLAWIGLSLLLFGSRMALLPWHTRAALLAGIAAAALMVAVQIWRVRTGRFVPTIDDPAE